LIRSLEVHNFKPFGVSQTPELAPITLIYGPNSSGKSSLIQALLLLQQSIGRPGGEDFSLIPRGDLIDLGSFRSLLFSHDLEKALTIGVTFDGRFTQKENRPVRSRLPLHATRSARMVFRSEDAAAGSGSPVLSDVEIGLTGELDFHVALKRMRYIADEEAEEIAPNSLFEWADEASIESFASYFLERAEKRLTVPSRAPLERAQIRQILADACMAGGGLLPCRLVPRSASPRSEEFWTYQRYLGGAMSPAEGVNAELTDLIRNIQYLGPLREAPERHYLISGRNESTVGRAGQFTSQVIHRRAAPLTRLINTWFGKFEIPYTLKTKLLADDVMGELVTMTLTDARSMVDVAPSDVGFGIGQLLPIVVQGLISAGQVICVEQPEIHLHPRLQAHLADFLIATTRLSEDRAVGRPRSGGNQWIVETHSEALMLRLQRRIREGKLDPAAVSVLYVRPAGRNGAEILRLRLDEAGEFIDEWPDGFFEESYREMFPVQS
jgi:predicted ATPase